MNTTTLLQQAHDALLSARHAIRNLLQGTDKANWPKWLAVADATDVVREQIAAALAAQPAPVPPPGWREALQFYADGNHFVRSDPYAWDTVSGEPTNFWCDDAGTATVEDGTVAKMALAGTPLPDEEEQPAPVPLTDEQIAMWFRRGVGRWMTPGTAFAAGVRSAERHHGIAASPEPAPVPLTDEQIINLRVQTKGDYKPWSESIAFARAIERAHGIAASPEVPK